MSKQRGSTWFDTITNQLFYFCLRVLTKTHNLWATWGPLISGFCLTKNQIGLLMHAQLIPHAWGFWMKENVAIVSQGFSLGSVYPLICLDCWIAQRLLFRYALLLFRMVLGLRYVCLYAQPMSAIHGRNKDVIHPNNKQWGDVDSCHCLSDCGKICWKPDPILHGWWVLGGSLWDEICGS